MQDNGASGQVLLTKQENLPTVEMLEIVLRSIWGNEKNGMRETADRILRHWQNFTSVSNPAHLLSTTFPSDRDELVLLKDLQFTSLCEHHLLPFYGKAHIGYLPNGKVVGLSKLPRCLDALARQPQIQERLTDDLARTIESALDPLGVAVVLEAEHISMTTRGVMKPGSITVTSSMRGVFRDEPAARAEFLSLIKK